jgi:hypothetical protein
MLRNRYWLGILLAIPPSVLVLHGCKQPPDVAQSAVPGEAFTSLHESDLGRGGKSILGLVAPEAYPVAGHVYYDTQTGTATLRASGSILRQIKAKQPRRFVLVELWRYDSQAGTWNKLEKPPAQPVVMRQENRTIYGPQADQVLATLTDRIGLYWVKWTEDGVLVQAPAYCGPAKPNDLDIAPAPEGMIIAAIPHEDSGEAGYVPDPRIYCNSKESWTHGGAIIGLGMNKAEVLGEIERSGYPKSKYGGRFGIHKPSADVQAKDIWDLGYGNSSGAAPGGGFILLAFREGRLMAIVPHGPYPA